MPATRRSKGRRGREGRGGGCKKRSAGQTSHGRAWVLSFTRSIMERVPRMS